jgi:hypothetical protein
MWPPINLLVYIKRDGQRRCAKRERMPRLRKPDQLFAESQENDRERSRAANVQGVARIRLDNLSFKCKPDNENVQNLRNKFKDAGCLRRDQANCIPAIIPAAILQHAIQASQTSSAALKSPPDGGPPELIFPSDYSVQCLHGCDRIDAAKGLLSGPNRWWTVEIYLESSLLPRPSLFVVLLIPKRRHLDRTSLCFGRTTPKRQPENRRRNFLDVFTVHRAGSCWRITVAVILG